jgi:hypothetical protein
MLVTDLVLLVTMFVGLLRLRRQGAGRFALGRLLWKQVRWRHFSGSRAPANVIFRLGGRYLALRCDRC